MKLKLIVDASNNLVKESDTGIIVCTFANADISLMLKIVKKINKANGNH